MMKRLAIYLVALVALVGCFKSEAFDTTLVVIPSQQLASGDEFTTLSGAVVYAFAADSVDYIPMSYDEALAGVVRSKTTGESLSPIAVGSPYSGSYSYTYEIDDEEEYPEDFVHPYADGELVTKAIEGLSMQIEMEEIMLVAVDIANGGYAYSNYKVGVNLPITYITLSFRPWKKAPFKQGSWMYVVPIVEEDDQTPIE